MVEQSIQEGYESDIEVVPNLKAQEVYTAYLDLNLTRATKIILIGLPLQ